VVEKIRTFLDEVKGEMKKVTWPTFLQTKGSTWAVIVTVILVGVYFGVLDFFLSKLINIFLG
jgi:preprotein translocase subunit SecE